VGSDKTKNDKKNIIRNSTPSTKHLLCVLKGMHTIRRRRLNEGRDTLATTNLCQWLDKAITITITSQSPPQGTSHLMAVYGRWLHEHEPFHQMRLTVEDEGGVQGAVGVSQKQRANVAAAALVSFAFRGGGCGGVLRSGVKWLWCESVMNQHGLHTVGYLVWGWGLRMAGKPVAQRHGNAGNLNHEIEKSEGKEAEAVEKE
jgi:hypothetical protein